MSTFGKKYINHWDYNLAFNKENLKRFNASPKEIKIKILENWYPIGGIFKYLEQNASFDKFFYKEGLYKVIDHNGLITGIYFSCRLIRLNDENIIYTANPLRLIPDNQWFRDRRISELGI